MLRNLVKSISSSLIHRQIAENGRSVSVLRDNCVSEGLCNLGQSSIRLYSTEKPIDDKINVERLVNDINLPEDLVSRIVTKQYDPTLPALKLAGLHIKGIFVPSEETHMDTLIGVQYKDLPIAHVHSSYQNTIVTVTDSTGGKCYAKYSPGVLGYKNAKKKTNVAAQAAGLAASQLAKKRGLTHVRVELKGMGKGRLSAIKGLEMGGLEIVSISDVSVVNWGSQKPPKKRRL